ncbi:aminoglycoside 3-N-acetyltransferase [Lactobacillus colini]|uniref:Aminoglycoside N(3)-acetyltransferase n=1 Tax=Lactobacillus colini TaxID=1819254 RepID=A0ABS4MF39_9LACO|nr:AAC(3) family N-acetyltransferase [Lactobacillus colini]MBP2058310.1 aminoglycoside 3-N-acetyltransferase [Lactobacillus colini]
MSEKPIEKIVTPEELKHILENNLSSTDSCIVHTALSSFGYLIGGEKTIVDTLKSVLKDGTIMMIAQTADLSDPVEWMYPPMIESLQEKAFNSMPPYDKSTPIHYIGVTPEYFRTSRDVYRNNHPLYSVCVWGKDAREICRDRSYDMPYGSKGTLQDMYDRDAKIVMLGTDYESCTALHLAESTIGRETIYERAPVKMDDGTTQIIKFVNVDLDKYDDINEFGNYFESKFTNEVKKIEIPNGTITIVPMRKLVDEAREYWKEKDKKQ